MIRAAVLAVTLAAASVASADDADLLGIQIRSKTQVGGQRPALLLSPTVPVRRLLVVLTAPGTKGAITLKTGAMTPGSQRELAWSQDVGTKEWKAKLDVAYGDGTQSTSEITFSSTVFPKIASRITKEDVDLEKHVLRVRLNQPAARVEIQVTGDDGKPMYQGEATFDEAEPDTPLEVGWEQPEGVAVLKIDLKVWSTFGFWVGTEVTPFEVEIPHEDVEFEFGSAEIAPGQEPKMQRTLELLREKIARYGGLVKLQLYIAGYTDTVGSRGSNLELSEQRARSIAAWFRRAGVKLPTFYQGFGEDVLAVQTPDETKEARNRRAVYVLSASAPAVQPAMPRSAWKGL